jgi:prepilin-type N-terminal cleavage/methylation domain-containing protein
MRKQNGFTLIEIAIVLVIIGLLLGGVLKGQELITSARVRNLISQQDGIKAAFFGFQDRFRAYPGDYASAGTTLKCPLAGTGTNTCVNGDGDGVILQAGKGDAAHEELLAWMHLGAAGFLNGSYALASAADAAASETNSPKNPYNVFLQLEYDSNYIDTAATAPTRHNLKTGAQIPVEIVAEVDRKIDDGNAVRGSFRFSTYGGNAPSPAASAVGAGGCVVAATGQWLVTEGATNCGGASLF